jgi:hypothetical protein
MKGDRIGAPYRWPIRVLLGTLGVISAGLIAVTLMNYDTTSQLAEQALQNTGLGNMQCARKRALDIARNSFV